MIHNPYVLSSLIASVALTIFYAAAAEIRGKDRGRRLWNIINLTLSVQGIVAAVRVIVVVLTADTLGPFGVGDAGYIILAGIVVTCVCFAYIYDTFVRVLGSEDPKPD